MVTWVYLTPYYAILRNDLKGHFEMLDDPLLTPKQVQEALQISRRKYQLMVANGELPIVRIGLKTHRIRKSALEKFLSCN